MCHQQHSAMHTKSVDRWKEERHTESTAAAKSKLLSAASQQQQQPPKSPKIVISFKRRLLTVVPETTNPQSYWVPWISVGCRRRSEEWHRVRPPPWHYSRAQQIGAKLSKRFIHTIQVNKSWLKTQSKVQKLRGKVGLTVLYNYNNSFTCLRTTLNQF